MPTGDTKKMVMSEKDFAYWERNQLVLYLTKLFPSWLEIHPREDEKWESDWRNIVFVKFPEGLYSWHIHDSEIPYFKHLKFKEGNSWDGSTTQEKYDCLREKMSYQLLKMLVGNLPLS